MKKILALVATLVLATVIPFSAFGDTKDASFFYGTWVNVYTQPAGRYTILVLHFADDGLAYYTRQIFFDGEPNDSIQEVKRWEVVDDGIIVTGEDGEEIQYSVYSDDFIGNQKGFVVYGYTRFTKAEVSAK